MGERVVGKGGTRSGTIHHRPMGEPEVEQSIIDLGGGWGEVEQSTIEQVGSPHTWVEKNLLCPEHRLTMHTSEMGPDRLGKYPSSCRGRGPWTGLRTQEKTMMGDG